MAGFKNITPAVAGFRLLTNPRFFRGFVLFEALSDDGKRLVAARASGTRLDEEKMLAP